MGTNYYYRHSYCQECGRITVVHIGKQSADHPFKFRVHWDITLSKTFEGWDQLLKGTKNQHYVDEGIFTEYNKKIPYEEFIKMPLENEYDFIEVEFS